MSSAAEPYPALAALEDSETERLYAAYADRILAYCTRRLRSRSDAEDAVQTTFLYAMRALRRGVEPECEPAWLQTIAKNVCSWQQRTAARRCPIADDFEMEALACAQTDEDVELLADLREALASLPERQRYALVLREWHGVPAREIAVELGLTGPQTHALLTRARHALAQALTAPRRAALVLGSLVYELRAQLKVLAGGASFKAAAMVTIAAAGSTGVAGAAVEESARQERLAREAPSVVSNPATSGAGVANAPARVPGVTSAADPGAGSRTSADRGLAPAVAPGGAVPSTDPASGAAPSGAPGDAPQAGLPLGLPAVPGVDLPTVLPPVTLPPVELPPVKVPPVSVGPVGVPPVNVDVPPAQLPAVEVPPVQVPPLPVPEPPSVTVPAVPPVPPLLPR